MVYFLMFFIAYKHTTGRIIKARIPHISHNCLVNWLCTNTPINPLQIFREGHSVQQGSTSGD